MKRYVLIFAAIGYLLTAWCFAFAFAPTTSEFGRRLLWHMCFSCMSVTGLHSYVLRGALLFLAPINAILYGLIGFLIGKFLSKIKGTKRVSP